MSIVCMEPVSRADVIPEKGFIHQIKWDGIRGLVFLENGTARIETRNGNECSVSYPELIVNLPAQLSVKQAVLDGEMVVFDGEKPSFYHALKRNRTRRPGSVKRMMRTYPVRYIVFDLLYRNDEDLRAYPLRERRQLLEACFTPNAVATITEDFEDGGALFQLMKQKNMEGIVSKRLSGRYTAGKRHTDWFKTKTVKKMLCTVLGIQREHDLPKSIMLGVYRKGELSAIGHVASGLKQGDLSLLEKTINAHDLPIITCWVKFSEWTSSGTLRHPVLLGFSDRPPSDATGEEISI